MGIAPKLLGKEKNSIAANIRVQSNCLNTKVFNHSDSIENNGTISSVQGTLTYLSVSPTNWMIGPLKAKSHHIRRLVQLSWQYIFSFHAVASSVNLRVASSAPW